MSIWTHVAGVIRIDGLYGVAEELDVDELLDKICGKVLDFNGDFDRWHDAELHRDQFMPFGSESSLRRALWVNPDQSDIARNALTVFGDLRDYSDVNAVIAWFQRCCHRIEDHDHCIGIRNAVITVECDDGNWAVWSSDGYEKHYLANLR